MDLNQTMIDVREFHESVEYYQKLGLRLIVSQRDQYARFELPSGSSTLSLIATDTPVVGNTTLYFEVEDVDQTHEALCALGIRFDSPPTDQVYRWRTAPFKDPTGNKLCLFHAGIDRRFPPWRLAG